MLLSVAVVVGCGGDDVGSSADELSQFISGVSDSMGNPATFVAVFATGAAPAESEQSKYLQYRFWAKDVDISGDSATVTVEISDSSDKVVAEVEWTAVREGGQWKLKTAPLP